MILSLISIVCFTTLNANDTKRQVLTKLITAKAATEVPSFVDGAPLSPVYVETVGCMAYLWAGHL